MRLDRLAATGGEGGGSGGEKQAGFLKAAASQPKGQRAQLDTQPADGDAFILWVLPITGAEEAGDQESPERPSTFVISAALVQSRLLQPLAGIYYTFSLCGNCS